MRVQESKQSGKTAIMGKKKHKLRKQAKENEHCPSDSSDDGGNAGRCPHLSKGINFNTMKKALKQLGTLGECTSCEYNKPVRSSETKPEDLAADGATCGTGDLIMEHVEDKMFEDLEPTIWVCLQCGHQGCDRNSKEQHALKHYQTPRSNLHAVVININTWAVWCYSCDDEVALDSSRKLQECIDYLRKQMGTGAAAAGSASAGTDSINRTGSFKSDGQASGEVAAVDSIPKVEAKTSKPKPISLQTAASVTQGLPKVKGLSNLGNTCFFNAVMQNLSQTYVLEMMLSERGMKGSPLLLNNHKSDLGDDDDLMSDSSSGSDEDSEDKRVKLSSISVSLGDPLSLTQSLVSFMRDMHNPSKVGTISPNNLFGQVCKKAPRFKGFQQQDSHELLRHLMDGMKAEEIKRSQAAILKQFHLAENTNPKKVDEDTKTKVKEYGRQAKHTFVDGVFGGVFISTVLCEECHVPSQVFEPFLDISLPILEEKTVRPNNLWSWKKKDESEKEKPAANAMDELAQLPDKGPSKHQQKKSKRLAKKEAKRKPKASKSPSEEGAASEMKTEGDADRDKGEKDSDNTKTNPDSHSQSDGEISDADVEDNIESDASRNRVVRPNSQEDIDKNDSPTDGTKICVVPADNSPSCSSVVCNHMDRCDSTGRSEESTLTETSAGESKTGCSSCNSLASLSDSTCKASSAESPFGSSTGINQTEAAGSHINDITDGIKKLDIGEAGAAPSVQTNTLKKIRERDSSKEKDKKSDRGSTGSVSLDGTEETASTSNGHHPGTSHRGRSSGYSSGTTTKSTAASSAVCSRAQFRLDAKFKAMSSLAPRYHPVSHECSVRSCLNQFTAAELLTGSNKFGCEICTKKKHGNTNKEGKKDTVYTNASKQVLVFQPPAILTLHLKRFQQVGFTLRKVNRHVEFPMMMDLAPYCSSLSKSVRGGQTKVLYALYGVVEHSGRLTGGHYTAYVKVRPHSPRLRDFVHNYDFLNLPLDKLLEALHRSQNNLEDHGQGHSADQQDADVMTPPPGKWYYISDSRVTEVSSEASVLRCQAYLLFYERVL